MYDRMTVSEWTFASIVSPLVDQVCGQRVAGLNPMMDRSYGVSS